ncbi:hypothetical protein ABPG72_013592 [Tetrahymena utriculariae]
MNYVHNVLKNARDVIQLLAFSSRCPDGTVENSDKEYLECTQSCTVKDCVKQILNSCSVGYYQGQSGSKNAFNCLKCSDTQTHCESCDSQNCIQCPFSYPIYESNTKSCLNQCPSGYHENQKTCKKCYDSQCTKCKSDYLIQQGLCVSNCEKGNFKQDKYCQQCSPNCLSCDTTKDSCIEYNQNYTLDKQRKICIKCIENCQNCSEDLVCQQCKQNYIQKDGICAKACDEGHFYKDSQCFKCNQECKNCEEQQDKCTDCSTEFKLNSQTSQCIKCPMNCIECKENQDCTKCQQDYKLQQNKCVKICEKGFYEDNNQECQQCDKNCNTCKSSASNCTKCLASQVLEANKLVDCPNGTYAENNKCKECPKDCSKCQLDQDNKIICLEKYDKDQGIYKVDKECKYCYGIQGLEYSQKQKSCVEQCGKGFMIKPNILKKHQISSKIQCYLGNSETKDGCTEQCMIKKGYDCKTYFEDQFILKQKCRIKSDGPSPQLNLVEIQKGEDGYQVMCQVQFDRHVKVSNFSEWRIQIKNKLGQDLQFTYKISPFYNQTDQLLKHEFNIFIKMQENFQNSTLTLHFPNKESVKDANQQSLIKLQANLDLQLNESNRDDYLEDEMKKNKKQKKTISVSLGSITLSCTLLMIFITKFYDFVSIFDIFQIINYLICLNVNIPNLAYQTMRIFDFASFEIIPNKHKSQSSAPIQFQIENYDTFFFSNMIQDSAIWGFSFFIYFISKLVVKYVRIQFLQYIFRPYEKKFKYFIIMGVAFLTSHDITLASLLQLYETNLNDIQIFGVICSVASLLFISGLVILLQQLHHLTRYPSLNMKDQNSQKHPFFLQNLKPDKSIQYFSNNNNIQVICKGLPIFSITIITFIAYQTQVNLEINENLNTMLGIALSVIFTIIFLIQFLSVVIKAIIKFMSNNFSQKFFNNI